MIVWKRWGVWAAHAFVNGVQQCRTAHGHLTAGTHGTQTVVEPGVHGVPYGRVCGRCQRVAMAKRSA
jgi:hypothetical protein